MEFNLIRKFVYVVERISTYFYIVISKVLMLITIYKTLYTDFSVIQCLSKW